MADHNEIALAIAPDVDMLLVYVPAGEFIMGEDAAHDAGAWDNEVPRRRVYLDGYWIGKYPATLAQYTAFLQATEPAGDHVAGYTARTRLHPDSADFNDAGRHNHPVTHVSWREAAAFCEWASRVTGHIVQLPSEAQWEKAARGSDGRRYPWGADAPDASRCNFNSSLSDTTAVGTYSPRGDSPYGCSDMAGNAWEWCADWYGADYYKQSPVRNPTGPAAGTARVLRGGAWWDPPWVMRCAFRSWLNPAFVDTAPGFRVLLKDAAPST